MRGWDGVLPLVWDSDGKGLLSQVGKVLNNVILGNFWRKTTSSHKPTPPGLCPGGSHPTSTGTCP